MKKYNLRTATEDDLEFLFTVSTEAMRPVVEKLNPKKVIDREEELQKYRDKFEPNKIQIIQHEGSDVGRLRIVRSAESIYVGGVQIFPAFQGKGIGSAIFVDLIEESKKIQMPIVLEVHEVNDGAISFYKKLGFIEAGKQENKIIMKFLPREILNKIIIIGDAGRGKSTLASALSKKLGIPHYSTDDYFYEIKFSKPRDKTQALDEISKLYETKKWIVEGTTQWLLTPGLDRADKIIYLRHTNVFSQWYVLVKRFFSRKEETFLELLGLMKHVLYKRYGLGYKKGKRTHSEVIAPYSEKVLTLSSFKEINTFLDSL